MRPAGISRWIRWMPTESSRISGIANRVHSSCWNCSRTCCGVTTRIRSPRPRRISSARISPISSVLPSPTTSASRMRGLQVLSARARPGAAGRSAGRAGTGPAAPGRARTAGSGVRRSVASRNSRDMANRGVWSGTRTVSSGLSRTGFGFSSSVKNTASSSRTSSDTPVARILYPSCSVSGAAADHPLRLADHDPGAGRVRGAAGLGHSAAPRAYSVA